MHLEYQEWWRRTTAATPRRSSNGQDHRGQVPRRLRSGLRAAPQLLPDRRRRDDRGRRRRAGRQTGTVTNYTVVTPVQYYGQEETEPFVRASILLDGPAVADAPGHPRRPGRRRARRACGSRRCGSGPRSGRRRDRQPRRRGGRRHRASIHGVGSPTGEPDVSRAASSQAPERVLRAVAAAGHRDRRLRAVALVAPGGADREPVPLPGDLRGDRASAGIDRRDIGFTFAGSCDYLSGQTFAFVTNLEGVGAWPPIYESHVEMDGAWAMYEAWIRLQEGDIDTRARLRVGEELARRAARDLPAADRPVHARAARRRPRVARRHPGPGADRRGQDHRAGVGRDRRPQPAQRARATRTPRCKGSLDVDELLAEPYFTAPLRAHDLPPISDGARRGRPGHGRQGAGDRPSGRCGSAASTTASTSTTRDPRPHRLEVGRAGGARTPAWATGRSTSPSCARAYTHEEKILREALGLGDGVDVNPSGGALAGEPDDGDRPHPHRRGGPPIAEGGRKRGVAHATSGSCCSRTWSACWKGTDC